jgi:DNA-3-methyladenine glycosylase II
LSAQKAKYVKSAARAVDSGSITAASIAALPSSDAALALRSLGGIGPWSAANILLRGFGRLDVFPPMDSGAKAGIKVLSGDPSVDLDLVLDTLGDMRGMLYFHLLLGRAQAALANTTG